MRIIKNAFTDINGDEQAFFLVEDQGRNFIVRKTTKLTEPWFGAEKASQTDYSIPLALDDNGMEALAYLLGADKFTAMSPDSDRIAPEEEYYVKNMIERYNISIG